MNTETTKIIKDSIKLPFNGLEVVEFSYSQASQDIFVLSCLNGKRDGMFLDLGSGPPITINNTYLLESKFHWEGISVDTDKKSIESYWLNKRQTIALLRDCTTLDFRFIIDSARTTHFDYLSLDLEPTPVTHQCLLNIPFNVIDFGIITYEHDLYRHGPYFKDESRKILKNNGYRLICSDVCNENTPYEDWYINEKYVDYERVKILECESKNWQNILYK